MSEVRSGSSDKPCVWKADGHDSYGPIIVDCKGIPRSPGWLKCPSCDRSIVIPYPDRTP